MIDLSDQRNIFISETQKTFGRGNFKRSLSGVDFPVPVISVNCVVLVADFECKLRAMGFDVTSKGEEKVAVADLTPIKQREQETKALAAPSPKVATMQVVIFAATSN